MKIKRNSFTLPEVLVATSLAALLLAFLVALVIYINRAVPYLEKKFSIAQGSKFLLLTISREILRASSARGEESPIISVNEKSILLYNVEIDNQANKVIYDLYLEVRRQDVNNGTNYTIKVERKREGQTVNQFEKRIFIEAPSNLYFQNINFAGVRIRIYNTLIFREKRENIDYNLDLFVNR